MDQLLPYARWLMVAHACITPIQSTSLLHHIALACIARSLACQHWPSSITAQETFEFEVHDINRLMIVALQAFEYIGGPLSFMAQSSLLVVLSFLDVRISSSVALAASTIYASTDPSLNRMAENGILFRPWRQWVHDKQILYNYASTQIAILLMLKEDRMSCFISVLHQKSDLRVKLIRTCFERAQY